MGGRRRAALPRKSKAVSARPSSDTSSSPVLFERVSFSFNKISVQYTPQAPDGSAQGATSFDDEWSVAASSPAALSRWKVVADRAIVTLERGKDPHIEAL